MEIESQLKRLPLNIIPSVRQHCNILQKRVAGEAQSGDNLMCLIISTKVLDDENDYDNTFWAVPFTQFDVKTINTMEAAFLKRLDWHASVME